MKLEVYKKKISKTYTQFNDINKKKLTFLNMFLYLSENWNLDSIK